MVAALRPCSVFSLLIALGIALGWSTGASAADVPAADQSLFITVRNPITSEEFSRVKAVTSAAVERYHKTGQKGELRIVYDFNPDDQTSSTSLFGPCLDLADYILTLNAKTIAFVHKDVSRHTVLPVIACKEIVMAPGDKNNVHIGNVLPDAADQLPGDVESFYKDKHVLYYKKIAEGRGRCPAIVLKMLDKNMNVLRTTRPGGAKWYLDERLKGDEKLEPEKDPVLPAGEAGFYTAKQARDFNLCQRSDLQTRQDVKSAYNLPDASLREDPLEGRSPVAWRVEIRGELNKALEETIKRRVNRAIAQGGNLIIVELACSGGDPLVARDLGSYLRTLKDDTGRRPIMTVGFVTRQASDNAVLIALGCNEIVLESGAKLGDFTTFLRHKDGDEALSTTLENMAKQRHYPPLLARAMVDRDAEVWEVKLRDHPGERHFVSGADHDDPKYAAPAAIKQKGKLLVLDANSAVKYGFARHVVENAGELYEKYGIVRAQVRDANPDWLDQVAEFLRRPFMEVILVMLGIACLILELKVPGISFPGILSAVCFLLFFWAHAQLAFLWLAVLLFILGLVLIAVEIFVTPGTAVLGVSGVVLMLVSLGLATLERWPQTSSEWETTAGTVGRFGLGLVGAVGMAIVAARYLPNIPYANRLMLVPPSERGPEMPNEAEQVEAARRAGLLGAIGVAATTLRPAGMVRFGDEFLDVIAEGSYVEAGTRVQVVEIEGNRIVVKEV
jgi:membrane-bound ClpP family serine protease